MERPRRLFARFGGWMMQVTHWCAAVAEARRARRITRAAEAVLFKIARLAGRYDVLHPSHEWLAGKAGCCRKTVVRALEAARAAGLLIWREQRWLNARGWRRGPNVYRLTMPTIKDAATGKNVPQVKQEKLNKRAQGQEAPKASVLRQLSMLRAAGVDLAGRLPVRDLQRIDGQWRCVTLGVR